MRFFCSIAFVSMLSLTLLAGCNTKKANDDGSGQRLTPSNMEGKKNADRPQPNMPPVPPPPPTTPPPLPKQ